MVQLEHSSRPHSPGCCRGSWLRSTAWRQVQDTAEATGPQDFFGQPRYQALQWISTGSVGHQEVAWSAWGCALRTAKEAVESLRHQLHKPVFKYFLPMVLV